MCRPYRFLIRIDYRWHSSGPAHLAVVIAGFTRPRLVAAYIGSVLKCSGHRWLRSHRVFLFLLFFLFFVVFLFGIICFFRRFSLIFFSLCSRFFFVFATVFFVFMVNCWFLFSSLFFLFPLFFNCILFFYSLYFYFPCFFLAFFCFFVFLKISTYTCKIIFIDI